MEGLWPWLLMALLGAYHGLNPAMGWLFAVALGLQEHRRAAVLRAFAPTGLGHALAVTAAVAAAALAGAVLSAEILRAVVAGALLAFGVRRLLRHSHPAWASMRVGFTRLTVWSFLMASAHGAGLMVLPVVLGSAAAAPHCAMHNAGSSAWSPLTATAIHSAGYLAVSTLIALVVFEKLGVGLLRKTWVNLDLIWAAALVAASIATLATA